MSNIVCTKAELRELAIIQNTPRTGEGYWSRPHYIFKDDTPEGMSFVHINDTDQGGVYPGDSKNIEVVRNWVQNQLHDYNQ